MKYLIKLSVPGLSPVEASGETLFACLSEFFKNLDIAGGCDAIPIVQRDVVEAVHKALLALHVSLSEGQHFLEIDGAVLVLSQKSHK